MLVSAALTAGNKVSNKVQTLAAKRVIDRFLSGQTDNAADIPYHVALDMQKVDGCDQYCVEVNRQGVLMINASSPVAACRAFYDYVRRHAYGICSWSGNRVDLTPNNIYSKDGMLILALTRKGQESFNGQVPQDNEPAPISSSSVTPPPESSSSSEPFIPPMSSSSEPITAIQQVRTPQMQPKEVRGIVNAKGAHVKEINRYRVNFKY